MKNRIKNVTISYPKDKKEREELEKNYTIVLSKIIINRIPKENLKQLIGLISEKAI